MPRTKKRSGSSAQFPARLHDMMEFVEANGLESVISWVLGGRGFMIHDPKRLVEILSLFFGQTKYTSFRRQLNMWHFERITHGPTKGTFLHPYFVKGNRELSGLMSRQVGVRDTRRPGAKQDEGLGSFTSGINKYNHQLNERLVSSSDIGEKAGTTGGEPAMTTNNTKNQPGPFDTDIGKNEMSHESYPSIDSWDFLLPQGEAALDLEPSPIDPLHVALTAIANLECSDKGQQQVNQQPHDDSTPSPILEMMTPNLSPSNDELSDFSLADIDLGCFAGKQFFLVDNNSELLH